MSANNREAGEGPAGWKTTAGLKTPGPAALPAMELCMRRAIAGFFRNGGNPTRHFLVDWERYRGDALECPDGESWESFQDKGQHLLSLFLLDEVPWKVSGVQAAWKKHAVKVPGRKTPREGIIDLVAAVEGVMSVVLFRVRVEPPLALPADLSCELAAALQAEPLARQAVACLFATQPAPRIQWHRVEPAVKGEE